MFWPASITTTSLLNSAAQAPAQPRSLSPLLVHQDGVCSANNPLSGFGVCMQSTQRNLTAATPHALLGQLKIPPTSCLVLACRKTLRSNTNISHTNTSLHVCCGSGCGLAGSSGLPVAQPLTTGAQHHLDTVVLHVQGVGVDFDTRHDRRPQIVYTGKATQTATATSHMHSLR